MLNLKAKTYIQDPWDLPSPNASLPLSPSTPTAIKTHKPFLISPANTPTALPITPKTDDLEQSLLRDWLKLKTAPAKAFREKLQQALGLLYWLDSQA